MLLKWPLSSCGKGPDFLWPFPPCWLVFCLLELPLLSCPFLFKFSTCLRKLSIVVACLSSLALFAGGSAPCELDEAPVEAGRRASGISLMLYLVDSRIITTN